ncbi:hypothetical protein WICPIJ_002391 [Wickerhamomyces pijperi]|uniref:DDHD domain-containing protein n=1 Tax=Wickerhamomyces pijperi TaxID=599730 RepID=A0A9P8TPQ0_WICPI|nr:hypothetical protein WICPIJ_002391 [Wickerhamomyces pijperi]
MPPPEEQKYFSQLPMVKPKWYQSTDSPKSMPAYYHYEQTIDPVKFEPFTESDQERIEAQYQKYKQFKKCQSDSDAVNPYQTVPVNEDHLFDIDFAVREVRPVYWEGASYEVRRGIWFYHESSGAATASYETPISYELTLELEKAYRELKPYEEKQADSTPEDGKVVKDPTGTHDTKEYYTLTGDHNEGKFVIFTDHRTAYIIDDINGYTAGFRLAFIIKTNVSRAMDVIRVTRGSCEDYIQPDVKSDTEGDASTDQEPVSEVSKNKVLEQLEELKRTKGGINEVAQEPLSAEDMDKLFQKLSKVFDVGVEDVILSNTGPSSAKSNDIASGCEASKKDSPALGSAELESSGDVEHLEKKLKVGLEEDCKITRTNSVSSTKAEDSTPASSTRKINHLIFCIHGVGQQLGIKYQSFNFIHGINVFRKLLQTVYCKSPDIQSQRSNDSENDPSEEPDVSTNTSIQVLPITWRHKIDFQPQTAVKEGMPSLQDITIDAMKPFREILGAVFFDLLIYYEPRYYNQILSLVISEINDSYKEYVKRNPQFEKEVKEGKAKVSIMGHSLGSAIGFEMLSLQDPFEDDSETGENKLLFPVENFFAVGSPVGLFQLLKTQKIGSQSQNIRSSTEISVPQCQNLYNIFHPCDPVAYRMEPLVDTEYKDLTPEFIIPSFSLTSTLSSAIAIPSIPEVVASPFVTLSKISDKLVENASKTWNSVSLGTKLASNAVSNTDIKENATKEEVLVGEFAKSMVEQAITAPATGNSNSNSQDPGSGSDLDSDSDDLLKALNRNGRIDYSLQQGFFDISVLSSVSAHINYFEDENVAWFILKEALKL